MKEKKDRLKSYLTLRKKFSGDPKLKYENLMLFDDGSIYRGQKKLVNKKEIREGYGIHVWPDGSMYEGMWLRNKANGKGKLMLSDGDIYQG